MSFEDILVRSLVAASTCRRCLHISKPTKQQKDGWNREPYPTRRSAHTTTLQRQQAALAPAREDISREDYKELVNTYGLPSDLWEEQAQPQAPTSPVAALKPPRKHHPLAPRLVIPHDREESPRPRRRQLLRPDSPSDVDRVDRLKQLLKSSPLGTKTNKIWATYSALPSPRAGYLSDGTLHALFQQLVWVEFKHNHVRFFEFLEECLDAGLQLTSNEWNSAIAFVGRRTRNVSEEDIKRAVETWMRMERANAKPTRVTFNILFDIASRTKRFALADTIFNELQARGMALDRYMRVKIIYNAGLRGNAEAVRQAFRDFVNAGEIVDTAVMNCVILSLVRCGEVYSAESVYEKMKTLHKAKQDKDPDLKDEPRTWQEEKRLGRQLGETAQTLREEKALHEASFFGSQYSNEEHKEEAQRRAPIAPDARTMRILTKHYCEVMGNLERVKELMAAMRAFSGERDGNGYVYLWVFDGFGRWGGEAYTEWNPRALEDIWEDFVDAAGLDDGSWVRSTRPKVESLPDAPSDPAYTPFHASDATQQTQLRTSRDLETSPAELNLDSEEIAEDTPYADRPVHYSTALSRKAVYAFYKCCGRKRARAVWETIQRRWIGMTERDKDTVEEYIKRLMGDGYGI